MNYATIRIAEAGNTRTRGPKLVMLLKVAL